MACRDTQTLLFAYLDHELGAAESERVRVHLTRCPTCRMMALHDRRFLASVRRAGEQLLEPAPPSLRDRVRDVLDTAANDAASPQHTS